MAEVWSSFTSGNTDNIPSLNKDPLPDIPSIQVYPQRIQHLPTNLDANKAGGRDCLQACFLKEVAVEVAPILSIVFQTSLNQGILPDI